MNVTREDKIRNEYYKKYYSSVASIAHEMRENRLRWLRHVLRKEKRDGGSVISEENVHRTKPKKRRLKCLPFNSSSED